MLRTISNLRSRFSVKPLSTPVEHSPILNHFPPLSASISSSPYLERRPHNGDGHSDELNGPPRLFVVQPRIRPQSHLNSKLEEALNLANSLEQQRDGFYDTEFLDKESPPHVVVQNPTARIPRADTFFRRGTVSTVKCHLNELESKDEVDAIFVNAILTGIQQRNLERAWGKPVLDRVGLIIEIFNAHAQTKEAKLQAELAALTYKKSRLVRVRGPGGRYTFGGIGEAEVVSARGRGSGGRGFISGAGESELELQRRRILDRRKKLLSEIKEVRKTRAMQRAARKRQEGPQGPDIATVAVVGYTNAGKSTLVSALSNSYLYCDDRLFATVDPKLTSVILPSGRKVLLSDTVGFISDLPVQLVEAFHATLEEVVETDLLVHVLDSSAPNLEEHRKAVMHVLEKIGVSQEKLENMIEVWNKVDLLDKEFDVDQFDDQDYTSSLSDEEEDVESRQHDDDQEIAARSLGDENLYEVDFSDGWLSCEDDEEKLWVDYDGGSIGCDSMDEPQSEFPGGWKTSANSPRSESDFTGHARTSAVTGVGLQELLALIDEKLGSFHVVERRNSVFNKKWRPPRKEDDQIAVEQ